jgi:hypothetical protein
MATYYWVYESTTRGRQSTGIIETATTAKPSWQNSESTLDSLHGPYSTFAQANTEVAALQGKETAPASSSSQSGYSGAPVSNAAGQEIGVDQNGNYVSTGNSDTNPGISIPGLSQIGDFFARLTEGSTWMRIGEALLGLVLIAVGMARITHAVPIATSIARTVGATGLAVA